MSYSEVYHASYEDISEKIGKQSIIKPIDASSSRSTFKITSSDDFENIKQKISRNYRYIIEEYIGGELYSVDAFIANGKMYILSYAREVAMIELSDKQKFSQNFLQKYGEEIQKHFNFILPLAYSLDFSKLSKIELELLEKLRKKLEEIQYT